MAPREQEPALLGLNFNQPLSWRAGKPIATGELHKRLDALSNELSEMDQEEIDKSSLTGVAKELAAHNLLNHKDKGVRAFTACCLVDVLKLCAPDAPFTGTQLKDIFTLFITSILPALSDPSNAYNPQHKYVLQSLAEVKSIVLVMDLPNADVLMVHLFSSFFDIISGSSKSSTGEQIAKDIQYHMTQMLVTLVDEASSLPTQAVDIIVAQFLRASTPGSGKTHNGENQDERQSTLLPKELPEAYNMAKTICNACPEKMGRYISQYFNEVIIDSSGSAKANGHRGKGEGSDDEDAATAEADMKELLKAHKLLRELWRVCPSVLQNVIPQLEAELSAENVDLRKLATETLGDIISGIGAAGPPPSPIMDPTAYPPATIEDYPVSHTSDSILTTPISPQSFAQTHPSVYNNFIGRGKDKSQVIRSGWTTAIGRILVTSAGGIGLSRDEESTLVKGLAEKLNDGDDKVRLAAVRVIATFSLRDVMTKLAPNGSIGSPNSVLGYLADRVRDRKSFVRVEAMTALGKIWGVATGEIAAGNESVITALGGIPSKIFDAYYANDLEINVLLDHVMFEQLIPLSYPPKKAKGSKATNGNSQTQTNGDVQFDADKIRTERILLLVKSLDSKSKKAFFAIQSRQKAYSDVLKVFLQRCEEYNGGVMDENAKGIKVKLDVVIKWFTALLPDSPRVNSDLQKYAKMHDRRSYQLLRFAMDPEKDFKTVHNSIREFQKRINEASTAPAGLLETLVPIIYRASSLVYNKGNLPAILQYSTSGQNELQAVASELNQEISQRMPDIFKNNIKELCTLLHSDVPSDIKPNDPSSVQNLRALAQFAKGRPDDIPKDRGFIKTLVQFGLYGTPAKAAKYAVNILIVATDSKEMYVKDLLEQSTHNWIYGEDHFLTKLATISQLSLLDPEQTDEANDLILDITTQQILLQVRTMKQDTDAGWQLDEELDEECEAKCWALKILVNRVRTIKEPKIAKDLAIPIFKLLNTLVYKNGEISKENNTPRHHRSRLRLKAAHLLLKLCKNKIFDEMLTATAFNRLACVALDGRPEVRRGFIEKLQKYLVKGHISSRFYSIMFIMAHEPEKDFKKFIMTWIRSQTRVLHQHKTNTMESAFARLLSLLAHHPDYPTEAETEEKLLAEWKDHAKYIIYYLDTVSTEENLGLIYKYAERVKQARDAIDPTQSERLYVLSDLAQAIIRVWEVKKGWRIRIFPGKVLLSSTLFAALPSHEVAQEIAEKDYLPEGIDDESLEGLVRNYNKQGKQKRKVDDRDEDGQPATKKVKSATKPRPRPSATPKPSKEKKSTKQKRQKPDDEFTTPVASPENRRKSGRGASAAKVYRDRDDSEDDEEMMEGVAEWEYLDDQPTSGSDQEANSNEDDSNATPSLESESGEEADEAEPDRTPPKPIGKARKPKTPRSTSKTSAKKRTISDEKVVSEDENEDVEMEEVSPPKSASTKKTKPTKNGVAQQGPQRLARGARSKAQDRSVEDSDEDGELSDAPAVKTVSAKKKAKATPRKPQNLEDDEENEENKELGDVTRPKTTSARNSKTKAPAKESVVAPKPKRGAKAAKEKSPSPEPEEEQEDHEIAEAEDTPPPKSIAKSASSRKAKAPILGKKVPVSKAPTRSTRALKGKGKQDIYDMEESE